MKMTIIIPTRNRSETLRYALLTCTSQEYADLSIIVSDNCSDDDTERVVQSVSDARVRYLRTPRRLSMRGNFEFALSHVTEGVVGFIGDDDALLPGAIERAATFLRGSELKAVTSVLAFYRWPSAPESIRNSGSLQFLSTGDVIRDSMACIDTALKGTGAYYVHGLPSLYYGFADVSLTKVRRGGDFFHSMCPDAYAAFAIALQIPRFGYLAEPLFVVGASGRSTGVSTYQKDAGQEAAVSFAAENDIPFHRDYVLCKSIAVVTHEAYAQALESYPETSAARASVMDLLRYMARETNKDNKGEILAAAIEIAGRTGIDELEVRKIFGPMNIFLSKLDAFAKRRQFRLTRNKREAGAGRVLSRTYPDLTHHGVSNSLQAAEFFAKELKHVRGKYPLERRDRPS